MPSSSAQCVDEEKRALECLYDAFGESCSVEEIASAFSRSKRDIAVAADILSKRQEAIEEENQNQFREISPETNSRISKSKKPIASLGTVSTVLGNSYTSRHQITSRAETVEKSKPLKIQLPKSVLDLESDQAESSSGIKKDYLSNQEIEQFLFSMLGDGFKLSMDVIREVLGSCGYNIKKSMEELLDFSTRRSYDKGKSIDDWTAESSGSKTEEAPIPVENHANPIRNRISPCKKNNLSQEVLNSLFTVPERVEPEQFKPRFDLGINRSTFKTVTKPLIDDIRIPLPANMVLRAQLADIDEPGDDDVYKSYREAARANWGSMKEYYRAAVVAFSEGRGKDAKYLLNQGKHYFESAKEFVEKSASYLDEKKKEDEKEFLLDLTVVELSNVVYFLKVHLCKLANIPSYQYLRIVIGPESKDLKKTKIRRKVIAFLKKESVNWIEDEANPGNILVQVDLIDLSELKFAAKYMGREI